MHASALARQASIRRVVVPAHSGAFSALGCLVSPLRYDAVQTYRARLDAWEKTPAEDRFRDLANRCLTPLLDEGVKPDRVSILRSVDLRYTGQNYEIEVPLSVDRQGRSRSGPDGAAGLRAAFEKRHRQLYGYTSGESVECVNVRVVARVDEHVAKLAGVKPLAGDPRAGEQRAYFSESGAVSLRRYQRARLVPGKGVRGPALIEDEWSTTLLRPGQRCVADRLGNLVIEVGR
jgi:N-methylhydantoinase A